MSDRITDSLERIERSRILIEQSAILVIKRPEHAKVILGSLGRMTIMENLGYFNYDLFKNGDGTENEQPKTPLQDLRQPDALHDVLLAD